MECLSPPMTETPTGSNALLLSLFEKSLNLESTVKAVMLNLCAGFSLIFSAGGQLVFTGGQIYLN